ncbi:MAG: class I SAM-dependent methyltransferase [Candidatus Gottesmanbacteria bacterium]
MNAIPTAHADDWIEYALLDSGDGEKLETFGNYTMIRPDPRAIWKPSQPSSLWENADAHFIRTDSDRGEWKIKRQPPTPWTIRYHDMQFVLHPTDFKHVGIFPEQAVNWSWMQSIITPNISVLNLFGYTGAATVAACTTGAHVTHVDSSKPSITWAHENCIKNNIDEKQTRWIAEDAVKFVVREANRGNTYDGIILDPPRFGRGAKGEVWKLADDLPILLPAIKHILSPKATFILLNAYTADLSAIALYNIMKSIFSPIGGKLTFGELTTKEKSTDRLLPQGSFVRWQK